MKLTIVLTLVYIFFHLYSILCIEQLALFSFDTPQLETHNIDLYDSSYNPLNPSVTDLQEHATKQFIFSEIAGLDNYGKPTIDQYHIVSDSHDSDNQLQYAPVIESPIPQELEKFVRENIHSEAKIIDADTGFEKSYNSSLLLPSVVNTQTHNNTNPWETLAKLLPKCQDAILRGYHGHFACCTMKNGDWMDPDIWSCHRSPSHLDAVFIRHFVRLSSVPNNLINIRALWLIDSLENNSNNQIKKGGILRAGVLSNMPCGNEKTDWSDPSQAGIGQLEVRAMSKAFYLLLGGNFLADLPLICKTLKAKPFNHESQFFMENGIIIEIKAPSEPISKNSTLSLLKQSIQNMNALNESNDSNNTAPVEGFPFIPLSPVAFQNAYDELEKDILPMDLFPGKNNENSDMDANKFTSIYETDGEQTFSQTPLHIENNFEFFTSPPVWEEGETIPILMRDLQDQAAFLNYNYTNSSLFKLVGPSTLRVESHSGLLLFSNVSITLDGDLRNDGTFFVGENFLTTCLEKATGPAQKELCRIPSLDCTGSLVAMHPINLLWLQIGRGTIQPTFPKKPKVWFGSFQYAEDLPLSARSTLTFFGTTIVTSILPGFSLSFKRLGFPPFPAPPLRAKATQLIIQNPHKSSDLLLYMDIFDDDGYINCCKPFYEEEVAEFSVEGASIIFGRYQSIFKSFGEFENLDISEQILIRSSTISMEENFFATSPIIAPVDSIATSIQKPQKKAGINKDIVYFQCTNMCLISNQSFKPKSPFKYVQIQRSSPKMNIIDNLK